MASTKLFPLANIVSVEAYEPVGYLWHIPKIGSGICPSCNNPVDKTILNFGGYDWHPECFNCSLCNEPFTDEGCVHKGDLILHQKCFKKCFCDRCTKCTKLISPSKKVEAIGKSFHRKCFICTKCGENNIETKFFTIYQSPFCNHCYEEISQHFPKCITCSKPINPSGNYKEIFYHGKKYFVHSHGCYMCQFCPNNLTDGKFNIYKGKILCGTCYKNGLTKICGVCNEPIFEYANVIESVWFHREHFICSVCSQPISQNNCVLINGILKCNACAAELRCPGCGGIVQDEGRKLCKETWHKKCIKCQFCNKDLSGSNSRLVFFKKGPCCLECHKKQKASN